VAEAGTQDLIVAFPDEILHHAVTRMVRHDIGRLPIVRRDNPRVIVGYLGRAGVMTARLRRHEEEHHREAGWLQALTQ
jgi:CBS domain-containing protein